MYYVNTFSAAGTGTRRSPAISSQSMPVQENGDKITATLSSGATVVVLLWGATVISWKTPAPWSNEIIERFFVSSKSAMDGSKPVCLSIKTSYQAFILCPGRSEVASQSCSRSLVQRLSKSTKYFRLMGLLDRRNGHIRERRLRRRTVFP